ncbi:sigma factor-like helix-turn-helix DNA-binding protein [Rhodococcus tibetensis]|uniref:Siderophore-interacting protein n=1 Tax=Rhodococcus tibetensis TaxID=2965064 RepID=A0ABT1QFK0_9NOCA|nr:sigma factor-like helix-turn-helix DNA-binding protein [Rhodococcus sp. FXJ9.536]MCQ4121069.1 siderophore-interacting protein [Rhodococcus sp. FXJ9.536]
MFGDDVRSAAIVAASGDRAGVERLTTLLWPYVVRYCRARLGNSCETSRPVDEVAQEALLVVARDIPLLASHEFPVREVYRRVAQTVARARVNAVADTVDSPPELSLLLQCLHPTAREIVLLRVIDGLSVHDTAGVLGVPVGRVLVVQHKALRHLRAAVV